ncbi:MAG: ATP-binding protein [Planktomarina sp.]
MARPEITKKWRPGLILIIGCISVLFSILPIISYFVIAGLIDHLGLTLTVGVLVIASALGGVILSIALWRFLLRPIRALAATSADLVYNSVAEARPLAHYGTSELRDLGQTVLDMADALQNRTRAVQAYSDHVTHELKSPLTAMAAASELLQSSDLGPDVQRELIDDIARSSHRMADLLDAMREFSRASHSISAAGWTNICDQEVINDPQVHVIGQPILPLSQQATSIILSNLIGNAKDHGADRIDIVSRAGGILVADNGRGMSEALMPQVFNAFFTTRRGEGGTGMGLAIVKSLAESGGCTVDLWRKKGGIVIAIRPIGEFVS